jgi:HEAT repeat protein
VPGLTAALGDINERVRGSAVDALGLLGAVAVPGLIAALGDINERVRGSAADALGRIGPAAAEAVPALTALHKSDWNVGRAAGEAIKRIRSISE